MSRTKSRVGVVIPSYNAGRSLQWTLDSLEAQRLRPGEVCVVFDGPDAVGEEVARRHPMVTEVMVRTRCSGGPAQPREDGWNRIRDRVEYIHFLDSDDLITPCFYEELVSLLDDDLSLSAVRARSRSIDDELIREREGRFDWNEFEAITLDSIHIENYVDVHPIPCSFVLFRVDSLSEVEVEGALWRGCRVDSPDGKQEFLEDIDLIFRVIALGRLATVGGVGGIYNVRQGSVSDLGSKIYRWNWRAYEWAIEPWADRRGDAGLRRLAARMGSMAARKYARSERNWRTAMAALLRDSVRNPSMKTLLAITTIMLGVDPQRRKLMANDRSHREILADATSLDDASR